MVQDMRVLLLLTIFIAASACGPLEKESIQPVAKVQTLAEVLGTGVSPSIVLTFKFEDIGVKPPIRRIPVPILGTVVSEIGNTLAEIFITLNQNWAVKQEPFMLELPAIDDQTLESLEIKYMDMKIVPGSVTDSRNPLINLWNTVTFKRANLKFLSRMTIFIANESMYQAGEWARIARFKQGEQELTCEKKCLVFDTKLSKGERLNLAKILKEGGPLYIKPDVDVKATPKRSFSLAGEIKIGVVLKPLF